MNNMFAAMLAAASAKPLPYNRRLAYLESTGTQYIDTLIKPRDYLVFRSLAELSITNASAATYWGENNGYWFGTANSQWTVGGGVNLGVVTGGKQLVDFQGTTTAYDSDAIQIAATVDDGAVGIRNTTSGRLASNGDYYLFALNSFTSLVKMSGRLYSQKIYGDGVLVRDLIPVLDFNDTPCLYDKVSRQLFSNQGTGQFNYA